MAIDVRHLAREPRTVDLICITDGSTRTLLDDGGAIVDGRFKPNGRRTLIYKTADKRNRSGQRLFYAASPIPPAFHGDPLAGIPTLDDGARATMATMIAARTQRAELAEIQADAEKKKSKRIATKRAKAAAAEANDGQ